MLAAAISAFFRYKVVGSVIILACWGNLEQTKFLRQLSKNNVRAIFSCDLSALDTTNKHGLNGVLYFNENSSTLLNKIKWEHFSTWYKWLIVGEEVSEFLSNVRYDADIAFMLSKNKTNKFYNILDICVHMNEGISLHPWATWTEKQKLNVTHETERIQRRNNLRGYPIKLSTPNGLYSPQEYPGTFEEYVKDVKNPKSEQALRRSYACIMLMCESLNATINTVHTYLHNSENDNSSMYLMVSTGRADFGGHVLRLTRERVLTLDYILPLWSLSVGFTYITERESSTNMYVEPFSTGVWLCFLGTGVLLAVALRVTARQADERRNAEYIAIASCLQQDANTVPVGISGRTVFLTLSICSMLVHAYYTSAVVSALMNSGRGGPKTLRELADSKLNIAAENYDWMKYTLFEVNYSADMTYLKTKKMTANFYQPAEKGIHLIAKGGTAYHTEYNSLYSLMKHLTDEQVCKLQQIDTVPEIMTYIFAAKRSQFYNVASSRGLWISETGLVQRTLSWWQSRQPSCRVTLLAERVTFGDVAPLITTVGLGAILAFLIFVCEIFVAYFRVTKNNIFT